MTISVNGATVDTGAPAQTVRAAVPVISAAGINDPAAIARQQLPNAVPASSLVAAYSANVPPAPKPPVRPASIPSNALAAQYIAQGKNLTSEDLKIFEAYIPTPEAVEGESDDYLTPIRIARGDYSGARRESAGASGSTAAEEESQHFPAPPLAETYRPPRGSVAQFVAVIPELIARLLRRPTLVAAQGLDAYLLAEERNARVRTRKEVDTER